MATIAEIISRHWPGNLWSMDVDDYATLVWEQGNPDAKPLEATIRALSATTDAEIAVENRERRQQVAMLDRMDAVLKALEVLVRGEYEIVRVLNDLRGKILSSALSGTLTTYDSTVVNAVTSLRDKLQQIRDTVT